MRAKHFIILSFLIFIPSVHGQEKEGNPGEIFRQANEAYFKNQFTLARDLYLKLTIDHRIANGHLFFNLGNVSFQRGDLGEAIFYYEKAVRLIPRDPDLRANLRFTMGRRLDQIPEPFVSQMLRVFFFWNSYLTIKELLVLTGMIHAFFWGFICLGLFWKKNPLKGGAWTSGFLVAIMIFSVFLKCQQEKGERWGILTSPEVEVRSVYLTTVEPFLKLHEGTRVELIGGQSFENDETWFKIRLANGLKGWVRAKEVGVL